MAKLLLDILSPLMPTQDGQPFGRLYQELVLLCPTEGNPLDPQTQANKIRTRLAEELWKRGTGPNEYSDEDLAVIYEAGQQITHEYPVNKDFKKQKFECTISWEDIELGERPEARDNTTYAFSVVSGCVYQRESLLKALEHTDIDPTMAMVYSSYELEMLGVIEPNRVHRQERICHFVLGIDENELDKRVCVVFFAACLINALFMSAMMSDSRNAVLNTFFGPIVLFTGICIFSSVGAHYGNYARETDDPILRAHYLIKARETVLVASSIILTPVTLAMYAVLGKVTGKMLAHALDAGDYADNAAQAGSILAPVFALALLIPLIKSYWYLRHLRGIDETRNAEEQQSRNNIENNLWCITTSIAWSAVGYLVGLSVKFLPGTPGAEDATKYGVLVGFLLGVLLTCISKRADIFQTCESVVGWGRRIGARDNHGEPHFVEMRSVHL